MILTMFFKKTIKKCIKKPTLARISGQDSGHGPFGLAKKAFGHYNPGLEAAKHMV